MLAQPGLAWKHAQTPHFVLHYEQAIFARKVARLSEFFYSFIAGDLQTPDRIGGRSHIFIFQSPARWQALRQILPDVPAWSFSQVRGSMMLLQQADDTSSSGDVLAHEMTHLVLNRFLAGACPLWLNEGLAGYYGEFAYAAFKGIKKSRKAQFPRLERPYPTAELLNTEGYPADLDAFYTTAKYVVGFLLLKHDPNCFPRYLNDVLAGTDSQTALQTHYGFKDQAEFERAFLRFAR